MDTRPTLATHSEATDYIGAMTLRRVRHFLAAPDLTVYSDLKGMCERVSDSYRDRVVIELLQNAHDAHDPEAVDGRIKVLLDPSDACFGTLYVANDGYGFTKTNSTHCVVLRGPPRT